MRPPFTTIPFTKSRKLGGTNAGEVTDKSGTRACSGMVTWCLHSVEPSVLGKIKYLYTWDLGLQLLFHTH